MMNPTNSQNSSTDKSSLEEIQETRQKIDLSQKQTQLVVNLSYFLIAVITFCLVYIEVFK